MSAYNLLLSSIAYSVHLLHTVSKVHQKLHIIWTNLLLSVTLHDDHLITVPLYTYHVNLYVHVVWRDTLWNWKVLWGNTVNNSMCLSCAMVHSTWHTASTYKNTRSVGMCTVPFCPPCTGVTFIYPIYHVLNTATERHLMQVYYLRATMNIVCGANKVWFHNDQKNYYCTTQHYHASKIICMQYDFLLHNMCLSQLCWRRFKSSGILQSAD